MAGSRIGLECQIFLWSGWANRPMKMWFGDVECQQVKRKSYDLVHLIQQE